MHGGSTACASSREGPLERGTHSIRAKRTRTLVTGQTGIISPVRGHKKESSAGNFSLDSSTGLERTVTCYCPDFLVSWNNFALPSRSLGHDEAKQKLSPVPQAPERSPGLFSKTEDIFPPSCLSSPSFSNAKLPLRLSL
jgi:hypothetical protein